MNLILDTQILVWCLNQSERLSQKHKNLIENADTVSISVMSCFEVAWLVSHHRIQLPNDKTYQEWFDIVKNQANIQVLPIDERICELAVNLSEHHKDPVDRLIIATTLIHNCHLASVDSKLPLYQELSEWLIN